jgi:hypothetical protein
MDRERVNKAHPAYPFIIRQVSADEAKVLEAIYNAEAPFEMVQSASEGGAVPVDNVETNFPRHNLAFPDNLLFYMNHLQQLGLATLGPQQDRSISWPQTRFRFQFLLTDTGARFLEACHSPN